MNRSRATLDDVADFQNLASAFFKAARGKHSRADVVDFRRDLEGNLSRLARDIRAETVCLHPMVCFIIHDPKTRKIHAPHFRDRILHHAIANVTAQRLEKSLVDQTFACRSGRGTIAAIEHAQRCMRRSEWFGQIDIAQYFPSIPHAKLIEVLKGKFSDHGLLRLMEKVLSHYHSSPERGLPIGALTSQLWANTYLGTIDRRIVSSDLCVGYVRYMDDLVWFTRDKGAARSIMADIVQEIEAKLGLTVKPDRKISPCKTGLHFCGSRILPHRILLSKRQKRKFSIARRQLEADYAAGQIDALDLQERFDHILAPTLHANAQGWRRSQLERVPLDAKVQQA